MKVILKTLGLFLGLFLAGCVLGEIILLFIFSITLYAGKPDYGLITYLQLTLPVFGLIFTFGYLYLEDKEEEKQGRACGQ